MELLDGAMGTELQRRGYDTGLPLWSANPLLDHPEVVLEIHRDYLAAGADIITTDTFRTTHRTFRRAGLPDRSEELTRLAVRLARQAREEFPEGRVRIAGSVGPLEDCYRPDLVPPEKELLEEHTVHNRRLAEAGVDLLLLETMGTVREARAAARAALATDKETIVSFLCNAEGELYGGEPVAQAVAAIEPLGPAAFSINCVSPHHMERAIEVLKAATRLPFGVYGNVGVPGGETGGSHDGGGMTCDVDVEEYAHFAERWAALGAAFIGGCCGTSPAYIKRLSELFHKRR